MPSKTLEKPSGVAGIRFGRQSGLSHRRGAVLPIWPQSTFVNDREMILNPYEAPHNAATPMSPYKPRFTFTVIELLVVIAILGMLTQLYIAPYMEHRRWRKLREQRHLLKLPAVQPVEFPSHGSGFSGNPPPNQP
jgi:hypothetical protein